ncbi:hypothetical protein [Clostridium sp. JN-1]|nr:hypothetical protein [Clostridium sp. JN-1]
MSGDKFSIGPASLYTSIKNLLDTELIKPTKELEQKNLYHRR